MFKYLRITQKGEYICKGNNISLFGNNISNNGKNISHYQKTLWIFYKKLMQW